MSDKIKTGNELINEYLSFTVPVQETPTPKIINIYKGKEALDRLNFLNIKFGAGLLSGYTELDEFFTFQPQQLYLLSAPTHHGKTMFSINLCSRMATLGTKVMYCSLEQGVFVAKFVENVLEGAYPESLWILDTYKMLTVEQLLCSVSSLKEKPQFLCIDHIHFLQKKGRGATEDIDEIILKLQNLAKELEIPVLVVSHLRKLNSDNPPELDDLRDSSSLSQVPSVVMFIHRQKSKSMEDGYLLNEGTLFIPKNRIQGKTGALQFTLEKSGKIEFKPVRKDIKLAQVDEQVKMAEEVFQLF